MHFQKKGILNLLCTETKATAQSPIFNLKFIKKIMINDSISDLFTRIRNACLVRREKVIVPYTQTNQSIVKILMQHGFIKKIQSINDKNIEIYRRRAGPPSGHFGRKDGQNPRGASKRRLNGVERQAQVVDRNKRANGSLGAPSTIPALGPSPVQKSKFLLTLKYENNRPAILQLQRLSRPGCRLYVKGQKIPKVCEKSQLSVLFLSTSKGILSDREAYSLNLGGEILGFVT